MSGRSLHHQPDGRVTVGSRKTMRRQGQRTAPGEAPLLRLVFRLQKTMLAPNGLIDMWAGATITVGQLDNVTVALRTFNREKLFEAAAWFLRKHLPAGQPPFTCAANMHSSSEADSWSMKWMLAFCDGHVVAAITPVQPLIFPGPP